MTALVMAARPSTRVTRWHRVHEMPAPSPKLLGTTGLASGAFPGAALLPEMAAAVGVVASPAPYGVEGFDYFAGMGELNAEDMRLFLSDPEEARRRHHEDWEEARAVTPEQLAEVMKSVLSPVDA